MKLDMSKAQSLFLEPGKYKAQFIGFNEKNGQNEGVKFYAIELRVLEGKDKGKNIYDTILFQHPTSEVAVNIGLGKIKTILKALSLDENDFDTEETPQKILFSSVEVTLKLQKDKNGSEKLVVAKYEKAKDSDDLNDFLK